MLNKINIEVCYRCDIFIFQHGEDSCACIADIADI